MNSYEIHFTVRGLLTTFAECINAYEIDRVAFRKILNERLKAERYDRTVDKIFLITER